MREMPTLRATMRSGGRGDFGRALLALVEDPNLRNLTEALFMADDSNQAAIERALPGALEIVRTMYNEWPGDCTLALVNQFKALAYLDEETDNPHLLDLKTGEPKCSAFRQDLEDVCARDLELLDAETYPQEPEVPACMEAALREKGVG